MRLSSFQPFERVRSLFQNVKEGELEIDARNFHLKRNRIRPLCLSWLTTKCNATRLTIDMALTQVNSNIWTKLSESGSDFPLSCECAIALKLNIIQFN